MHSNIVSSWWWMTKNGWRFYPADLEHDGFQVVEAYAVCKLFRLSRYASDLVLLDVMMPDLDGLEVLSLIRETSAVPLLCDGEGEEDDRVRGLELGAMIILPNF